MNHARVETTVLIMDRIAGLILIVMVGRLAWGWEPTTANRVLILVWMSVAWLREVLNQRSIMQTKRAEK